MKIKTKKNMSLDELIKYIISNGVRTITGKTLEYTSINNYKNKVYVDSSGGITTCGRFCEDAFTIEVEQELTENIVLDELVEVYYLGLTKEIRAIEHPNNSIREVREVGQESTPTLAIYCGKTLIWSREYGIPVEGVVEV